MGRKDKKLLRVQSKQVVKDEPKVPVKTVVRTVVKTVPVKKIEKKVEPTPQKIEKPKEVVNKTVVKTVEKSKKEPIIAEPKIEKSKKIEHDGYGFIGRGDVANTFKYLCKKQGKKVGEVLYALIKDFNNKNQ